MKSILLSIIVYLISLNGFSQELIDNTIIVGKYKFYNYNDPTTNKINPVNMILLVGKKMSLYKEDIIEEKLRVADNTELKILNKKNRESNQVFLLVYGSKDKMWVSKRLDKDYYWEEHRPNITWEIKKTTSKILGYKSFLARGLSEVTKKYYNAWFTYDLPFSTGPVYATGLPGLILKLESDDRSMIWEIDKLEKPNQKTKKITFTSGSQKTTKTEFQKKLNYIKENKEEAINKMIKGRVKIN